ncbi:MAG: hypothetical protein NC548_13045 [Lachnospiraceae bacterium]|nr:hypothetical protein [Lachnospiraceae bacterium]MCM1230684.1 hypothetical protein [Ruminococcus flavefaciens]
MKNKEIERKFLINDFPEETSNLKLVTNAMVTQSYLSINPEVRIRRVSEKGKPIAHFLTIKSNGDMIRDEINLKISRDQYESLQDMIGYPAIEKQFMVFENKDGLKIECSKIDPDSPNSFSYAEVEFENEKNANEFKPLEFFVNEVTSDPSFKMKNYWVRTRYPLPADTETKTAENTDTSDGEDKPKTSVNDFPDFLKDIINATMKNRDKMHVVKVDTKNGTTEHFDVNKDGSVTSSDPDEENQNWENLTLENKIDILGEGMYHLLSLLNNLSEYVYDDKGGLDDTIHDIVRKECNRVINANYGRYGVVKAEPIAPYTAELRSCECLDEEDVEEIVKEIVDKKIKKLLKSKKFKKTVKKIGKKKLKKIWRKAIIGYDLSNALDERMDELEERQEEIEDSIVNYPDLCVELKKYLNGEFGCQGKCSDENPNDNEDEDDED